MGDGQKNSRWAVGREHVFLAAGLGCYWAWMHLMFFVGFGSFYAGGAGASQAWEILAPCALAFCLAGTVWGDAFDRVARKTWVRIVVCLLAVMGTWAILAYARGGLCVLGVLLTLAFGQLAVFAPLGRIDALIYPRSALAGCYYAGMIASFVLYLVGYVMPGEFTGRLCMLLPVGAAYMLERSERLCVEALPSDIGDVAGREPVDCHPADAVSDVLPDRAGKLRGRGMLGVVPLVVLLYVAVSSLAINCMVLILGATAPGSAVLDAQGVALTAVLIGTSMVVEAVAMRRGFTSAPMLVLFFLFAALLIYMATPDGLAHVAAPFVSTAYFLSVSVGMLKVAESIAARGVVGSRFVSLGIAANMLGLNIGALAFWALRPLGVFALALCAALLMCLFVVVSLLVTPQDGVRVLLVRPSDDSSSARRGGRAVDRTAMVVDDFAVVGAREAANTAEALFAERVVVARQRFVLTEREADVLGYLLRGRELQTIADDMGLSRNTIKTYVARLYQKMDVHTREECAMAVEHLVNEQA